MKILCILIMLVSTIKIYGQGTDTLNSKNERVRIQIDGPPSQLGPPLFIITADYKRLQFQGKANKVDADSTTNGLNYINPDWIQTLNVIKGKEATDKYGPLGKNGVILIELKNGTLEKLPLELREKFKDN
jgi:hypothetical protein